MSDYQQVLQHPFYRDQENYRHDKRTKQNDKGLKKWGKPFNPADWSNAELADHAYGEIIDAEVYVYAMYRRMEEQQAQINSLRQDKASLLMQVEVLETQVQRLEAKA